MLSCIKIMTYFQILKQVRPNKNEVRIPGVLPLPLSCILNLFCWSSYYELLEEKNIRSSQ